MWKKFLISLIALVGIFSVGYAYYNYNLSASSYNIGGNVYGRIGSPVIGDRIFLGTKSNFNKPMGWALLEEIDFNDSYFAHSTSSMDKSTFYDNISDIYTYAYLFDATKTNVWKSYDEFNAKLTTNTQDMKVVANRHVRWYKEFIEYATPHINNANYGYPAFQGMTTGLAESGTTVASAYQKKAMDVGNMMRTREEIRYGIDETNGIVGLPVAYPNHSAYEMSYIPSTQVLSGKGAVTPYPFVFTEGKYHSLTVDGVNLETFSGIEIFPVLRKSQMTSRFIETYLSDGNGSAATKYYYYGALGSETLGSAYDIQAIIEFKKSYLQDNVVFSVSQPQTTGNGTVKVNTPKTVTGIYNTGEDMKLRILASDMQVSFEDIYYKNESIYTKQGVSKNSYAKIEKDKTVQLQVSGNSGSNSFGTNTISALVLNSSNEFVAYAPLATTIDGSQKYELDFNALNLTPGNYTIKVVNEKYNTDLTETSPADCSALSDGLQVEVVEPLSISYQASSSQYRYNDNAKAGNTVGSVSFANGIKPFTIQFDTTKGNAYQNFEFSQDSNINGGSISIKVKNDAPNLVSGTNSLKAGTYEFCMIARDLYGDPVTPTSGKTNICATVNVEKIQPTITFDNDDQGTTYISGDPSNTTTHEEHATHTNSDISNNDVNIEYSLKANNQSVVQNTNNFPYTSTNAGDQASIIFKSNISGTIELQAKIPESDNYIEAITTKTIVLQLGITANYLEDKTNIKAGSNEAQPPTSYTSSNRIGHVMPSGGTAPFQYSIDNSSFYIDTNGNVYVNQSVTGGLMPGNYDITITVTDSTTPNAQTTTVKKTITVSPSDNSGFAYEDPKQTGQVLNGNKITVTYDPSGEPNHGGMFNTKLLEIKNKALSNTSIQFALDPNSANDVVEISGFGSGTSNNLSVTVKKAGTTKVIATVTNGIYGTTGVTKELEIEVLKYNQTIAFKDANKLKLPVGSACVSVPADITSRYSNPNETITYSSDNTNANAPFTINSNGEVCPTSNVSDAGTANLIGTLKGNDNYSDATTGVPKAIEIYVPGNIDVTGSIQDAGTNNVTYTPGTMLVANDTTSNKNGTALKDAIAARIHDNKSSSPQYQLSTNSGNQENADAQYFTVVSNGNILLNQDVYASDIANRSTGTTYYIQVDVTDDNGYTTTVDVQIVIEKAKADFYFTEADSTKKPLDQVYADNQTRIALYEGTYAPNGTLDVYTNINAVYSEDTVGDTEVIDLLSGKTFTIKNASDESGTYGGMGGKTYVKACMNETGGHASQCIYAQVEIKQAEQKDFAFVNSPTWKLGKTPAVIQPTYNNKKTDGDVLLQSSDDTIAEVQAPVKGQDQSFKTMGKTGTVTLTAIAPENRNYKEASATTTLEVTEKPPITLQLYPEPMTYGDSGKIASITSGYKNGIPAYFYTEETDILEIDGSASNSKDSLGITAIGHGQVTIMVCQTDQPFDPSVDNCGAVNGDYGEATITVKQKPISFTYNDEEIYVGEAFPEYSFMEADASNFAFTDSMDDFKVPQNTSAKEGSSALPDTMKAGSYDISGGYSESELSEVMRHYDITINKGTLVIKQDQPQTNWYHLEDPDGNTVSASIWHNYIVDVVIDNPNASAGSYDQISDTINFTNSDKTRFTITEEDENKTDIYFRIDPNGSAEHKGAISDKVEETIKIDMTKPQVTSITGYPVNTDGISNLLNEITLGHFFKPGIQVEIAVNDPKPTSNENAKVSEIKDITYKVYKLDEKGVLESSTPIQTDTSTPGTNNKLTFKINEIGNYRVCAITTDHATNESDEKCSDLNIKKIDIDVDGDGDPDFNDVDGDGCADTNIKYQENGKWITINGDLNHDGIPDYNIDSDGDGKPDLNIDTDNDGKPDVNLVILKEWKPTQCSVTPNGEEYASGINVKPEINIDVDGDNIPDIDIDNKGDFKPHLNISINGKDAAINLTDIHEWKPNKDYVYGSFHYDSIGSDVIPQINIDSDGDGRPDINIDPDGDKVPDLNIDTDGDLIPDLNIDSDGDGKPDLNIDTDNDGKPDENIIILTEWKPEHNVDQPFKYDTMKIEGNKELVDNGIQVEKPNGVFLPNYAIKVTDITDRQKDEVIEKASNLINVDQEVKQVYDVKLLENGIEVQPDGILKIRIPIDSDIQNPVLLKKSANSGYEKVNAIIENGYLVYESAELGIISIIADKEEIQEPDDLTEPQEPIQPDDDSSVQGNYYPGNNVGGASTGDTTNLMMYFGLGCLSIGMILLVLFKRNCEEDK